MAAFLPAGYTQGRDWPLIVFLHGMGERGSDGWNQTGVGLGPAIRARPEEFRCLVAMPQCPADRIWACAESEPLFLAALDEMRKRYAVDRSRTYLTGISMGGSGTWWLGARHIEQFAALVPICGESFVDLAPKLVTRPIWAFHGALDETHPVELSRRMVAAVRAAGGEVRYTEYPKVGHDSWDPAYGASETITWLLEQEGTITSDSARTPA